MTGREFTLELTTSYFLITFIKIYVYFLFLVNFNNKVKKIKTWEAIEVSVNSVLWNNFHLLVPVLGSTSLYCWNRDHEVETATGRY